MHNNKEDQNKDNYKKRLPQWDLQPTYWTTPVYMGLIIYGNNHKTMRSSIQYADFLSKIDTFSNWRLFSKNVDSFQNEGKATISWYKVSYGDLGHLQQHQVKKDL